MSWLRHPRTTQEARLYDRELSRAKRSPARLPNSYDDIQRSHYRCWKAYRSTQYRPKKEILCFP